MDYFLDQRRRRKPYYAVLGVQPDSSTTDVRTAYRKLAMKWHPDRWSTDAEMSEEAKRRFQAIQEAYEVLSNQRKRVLYDAGMYDSGGTEEEVEGFGGFVQEMLGLMANVRREEKSYSMDELWGMLQEMGGGSGAGAPPPPCSAGCKRRSSSTANTSKRSRGTMGSVVAV